MTPEELFGVQKATWFKFEALRRSGIMNMWGSREPLGLSEAEFAAIIQHYDEMAAAWKAEFDRLAERCCPQVAQG